MNAKGTVHKFGDNVDTDVIIPARYLNTASHKELAAHCMEDIDAEFVNKVHEGDIMVAEKNFGCGSSREHAPIAIKDADFVCKWHPEIYCFTSSAAGYCGRFFFSQCIYAGRCAAVCHQPGIHHRTSTLI